MCIQIQLEIINNDTLVCAIRPHVTLIATNLSGANGVLWTGGSGTFDPSNTVLTTKYTPTAAEITNGFVDLIIETTNIGAGCNIAYDTVRISFLDTVQITLNATPISCSDDLSTITAVASGGDGGPYAYQWNNGLLTSTINQSPGDYTVSVTDGFGCQALSYVTVSAPPGLVIVMSSVDVSNVGICDGEATATVSDSTAPYTYLWNDGQTSSTATGLCYGIHTLTVTDANGCTEIDSITLLEPQVLSSSVSINNTASCFGASDASMSVTASGGMGVYQYFWSNGETCKISHGLSY